MCVGRRGTLAIGDLTQKTVGQLNGERDEDAPCLLPVWLASSPGSPLLIKMQLVVVGGGPQGQMPDIDQ